ncbi:ABC transporter substrate-binding protein [Actinomadura citrea]|uniref:Multiple sugar transport system substrate-binding protein n=1 Tax=Actinomadura citrea TaxID=46158 RepID=A0A7Y9GFT3_9ACTN|nr:ABC transporter substrate-binding protein [Actinomadura citrea]NYE15694.1 multiple sugar transport system substrate-binding protein [Actinomadura citrea]GGT66580.1 ABC transporter substrate-binding protein [Actinomadura citrea]
MTIRLLPAAAALSLLLASAACGDSSGGPSSPAGNDGRGPVTVATGKDLTQTVQRLVAAWNDGHPKERVRLVELPEDGDQARQQLVQNMQIKSDAYDVVRLDAVWTAEFAARRWILPLPDGLVDASSFVPAALETGKYRGRLYAAPWLTGTGVLYYREDLLAKAGVKSPPKTWAELRDACAKVRRTADGEGVDCYAGQYGKYEGLTVNYSEAVQSAGGEVFDSSGRPRVNTPQAKAGLRFLVDAFENGTIPQKAITFKEEEGRRAFQEGHLVFHRNWAYAYALAAEKDGSKVAGKFGVAPIPGEGGPGSGTLGGNNLAVSAFSKHQATARDFIAHIVGPAVQHEYGRAQSFPLSLAALYGDPEMIKRYPYLPVLRQGMDKARPRPVVVRYNEVSAAVQEHVTAALTGRKPVDRAAEDLQKALAALAD